MFADLSDLRRDVGARGAVANNNDLLAGERFPSSVGFGVRDDAWICSMPLFYSFNVRDAGYTVMSIGHHDSIVDLFVDYIGLEVLEKDSVSSWSWLANVHHLGLE